MPRRDIESLQKQVQISMRQLQNFRFRFRPRILILIEPLLEQTEAVLIPKDDFQVPPGNPTEKEGALLKDVEFHLLLDQNRQAVDDLAHIRTPRMNVDAVERAPIQHDRAIA